MAYKYKVGDEVIIQKFGKGWNGQEAAVIEIDTFSYNPYKIRLLSNGAEIHVGARHLKFKYEKVKESLEDLMKILDEAIQKKEEEVTL